MPEYKLRYFNTRGLAEVARILMALGDQKYEDIRYEIPDWPKHKDSVPFGAMPVLEVDGKPFCESGAINRYLARKFGLYGKTDLDTFTVDMTLCIIPDIMQLLLQAFSEKDEAKKAELVKSAKEEKVPPLLKKYEQILKSNGSSGYFVGNSISVADIAVYDIMDKVKIMLGDMLPAYPLLKKTVNIVAANPKVKAWVARRPATDH